jgi:hypothetical protein
MDINVQISGNRTAVAMSNKFVVVRLGCVVIVWLVLA